MIEYTGFTKRFGRVEAVRDLDLAVRPGETLALIGPNGSGKTTTLKAALGLVRPTSGSVIVDGLDPVRRGKEARRRIGYLPQRLSFPEGCTAREVLAFHARLRGDGSRPVDALLDRVGLGGAADRVVQDFSGGMSQRLGLAVALAGDPAALVMDEPTAALDPTGSLTVRDLVSGIAAEGRTVLLSSHDLAEVQALADRVAVFVDGGLAALGSPVDLARTRGLATTVRVAASAPGGRLATVAEAAGATAIRVDGDGLRCEVAPGGETALLDAIRTAGIDVRELSVTAPGMEDIYRAVTGVGLRLVA